MMIDVMKKHKRLKPRVLGRPSDVLNKRRFDLEVAYKDGGDLLVQTERRNYERPRPGRFNDGVPVRRATLDKPKMKDVEGQKGLTPRKD